MICRDRIFHPRHLLVPAEDTDTEDTDDEHDVGGMGRYSHKGYALVHQHWVSQVVRGGCFGVHCTESAEASHKTNMGLASHRVQHRRPNTTQENMLKFLCMRALFEELRLFHARQNPTVVVSRCDKRHKFGVRMPLFNHDGISKLPLTMGSALHSTHSQEQFLHREVRVARVELLDLVCAELELPATQDSYKNMNCLTWTFGQKLNMSNGTSYWATDSRYATMGLDTHGQRRDVFLLKGTEPLAVRRTTGQLENIPTALCCESTCFVTIGNIDKLFELNGRTLPDRLQDEVCCNSLIFILG